MGQYYYPLIMDAGGCKIVGSFYSHSFDHNGLKLMEHSYVGNFFVESIIAKAMSTLKPFTLVWLGDYADVHEDLLPLAAHRNTDPANNKGHVHRDYGRMMRKAQQAVEQSLYRIQPEDPDINENLRLADHCVIYDLVTRQKLVLRDYKTNVINYRIQNGMPDHCDNVAEFIIHPLPLLTCLGNGKGGGDYHGRCMEWVGAWSLHALAILPEGLPDPDGEWEDISSQIVFEEDR